MSYAIFTIYYGFPLSNQLGRSSDLSDLVEFEPEGLHTHYSGSADYTPAAFGVRLGEFNECCHHVEVDLLKLVATKEQLAEFQDLFKALSAEDRTLLLKLGDPRVFFLVNSS